MAAKIPTHRPTSSTFRGAGNKVQQSSWTWTPSMFMLLRPTHFEKAWQFPTPMEKSGELARRMEIGQLEFSECLANGSILLMINGDGLLVLGALDMTSTYTFCELRSQG